MVASVNLGIYVKMHASIYTNIRIYVRASNSAYTNKLTFKSTKAKTRMHTSQSTHTQKYTPTLFEQKLTILIGPFENLYSV